MIDQNLGSFSERFAVSGGDIRLVVAYDSRSTGAQVATQGSLERAIVAAWPLPLRSDESSPVCGLFGGTGATTSNSYVMNGTHGWTLSARVPGAAYSDSSTGNNPYSTTEFSIAGDSSRTAYVDGTSNNGVLWAHLPQMHSEAVSAGPMIDTYGGHPFSGVQCHARHIALGSGTAGPTDMILRAIRHVDNWTGINSTARTAYPTSNVTPNYTGTSVVSHDVDCGTGVGLAGYVLANPTSVGAGADARRIFHLGSRIFRSSGGNPLAGFHIGSYGNGAYTIGQACATLGISGQSGLSPDPYVTEAIATAVLRYGWGRGTGNDGPTHILCFTGANFAGDEQTELAAGTVTSYRDRHILWGQKMSDICYSLNGNVRPKICFVFNPPVRNGFSGTLYATALKAVRQAAAAVTGASFMDFFTPLNTKSLAGATPWASPYIPPFSKGNVYRTTNTASSGPQNDGSADYVHHSRGGDLRVAWGMWCRMFASIGKDPGLFIGMQRPRTGASNMARRRAGSVR